ncbi:CAP domain-containing protein [Jannaschia sp. LMIT008]|uniref:CAP domain-containing protein n=1 Tax=Jannaschia maritima TaxID=3032585 RepID=UPI0028118866|nr:CAP domain-containing protein [Jannaschia sp. LMIT008]
MNRRHALLLLTGTALSACTTPAPPTIGPDGQLLPQAYRITGAVAREIPGNALQAVNALRAGAGAPPVRLDDALTRAARVHSRDMSLQNRPWHFGSDGTNPIDRARRAGYGGRLLGEAVAETFETETQTIAAWAQERGTRRVLVDRTATDMGFSWFQEPGGKIWWTLNMGAGAGGVAVAAL